MFDGRAFLGIAALLLAMDGDEAAARSAVGRAYYAVFHVGRQRIEADGGSLAKGPAGHQQLARILGSDLIGLGQNLERLRKLRNTADDDPEMSIDPAAAAAIAVGIATAIIQAIDELSRAQT